MSHPVGKNRAGVIALGPITRSVSAQLEILRHLRGETQEETLRLRRYILGLVLVVMTAPLDRFLRSGCSLIPVEGSTFDLQIKYATGRRESMSLTHEEALAFANTAASDFGVGPNRQFTWDAKKAYEAAKEVAKEATKNKTDEATV
jgi:CRISPR-associated protein Csb1